MLDGGSPALPAGLVQSLTDYARELEHFLALDSVEGPFVLFGCSYGGFVSRANAGKHPDQIQGIVSIDSPHSHWMREMKARMPTED